VTRARSILAVILAGLSLLLALSPWLGRLSFRIDAFSAFLPIGAACAVLALLVGFRAAGSAVRLAAIAGLLLSAIVIVPELLVGRGQIRPAQGPRITIVTHNLSARNVDPQGTVRMLLDSGADVLLLQEAHGAMAPFLSGFDRAFPYHNRCPATCDLTLYSRLPITPAMWKLRDSAGKPFGPELLWTRLALPNGTSAILATVHRPWTIANHRQFYQRRLLADSLRRIDRSRLILAGDFNLTPWGNAMRDFEAELSPMTRATRGIFSFPARLFGAGWPLPFLPIDHMFVGPEWKVVSVERLPRTGSDHYPIRVTLELRQPGVRRATAFQENRPSHRQNEARA
jgi:vancomycin resistance protein VanJ